MFVDAELEAKELQHRRGLVDYAQSIGILVMSGWPEDHEPGRYSLRSSLRTSREMLARVPGMDPALKSPKTVTYSEYLLGRFLPLVARVKHSARGENKFLIETVEQWERLESFMTGGQLRKKGALHDIWHAALSEAAAKCQDQEALAVLNGQISTNETKGLDYEYPIGEHQRDFTRSFDLQEFVDTPSDRFTSYRVLVSASGAILASSLYYSGQTKADQDKIAKKRPVDKIGWGDVVYDFLTTPGSLVYLESRKFQSNQSLGGRGIVLDPGPHAKAMNAQDRKILATHGIDPDSPSLPAEIARLSTLIGRYLGPKNGVVMGIDWLQDRQGNYYYLETNFGPGPVAYIDAYHGGDTETDLLAASFSLQRLALQSMVNPG